MESAPAAAPAAAPSAAPIQTETDGTARKMQYPFDPEITQCVPDIRALCSLPADPDEDGVHTLRALLLPKGKSVHVPDEPGCYATIGPFRTQTALCIIHFHESTQREDELLLSFVDYGMVSNGAMHGIYVMTLQLPLQKARNQFEETPRFTSIKDVCGFTNIKETAQPWCVLLKPALERHALFTRIAVFNALDVVQYMRSPLAVRLLQLREGTEQDIAKLVEDLARQDKRAAEKQKGKFYSRLDATLNFFDELGPSKYDRAMKERIIKVASFSRTDGVQWLTTPDRSTLAQGRAKLASTSMRRLTFQSREAAPAPEPVPSAAPAAAEAEDDSSPEFAELSGDEEEAAEPAKPAKKKPLPNKERAGSKRARTAPNRLEAELPSKVPRPKGKSAQVKKVCSLWPLCSLTSQPCL